MTSMWRGGMVCTLVLLGCTADKDEPVACEATALEGQPTTRLVAGTTYWLPSLDGQDCPAEGWSLVDGDAVDVVAGSDGMTRFTPSAAGSWTFEAAGTSLEHRVTAVATEAAPFLNYNYYPTHAQALVDGELWVAEALAPRVARLDAATLDVIGYIAVGSWPVAVAHVEGAPSAVVVHKASDTVGVIDVADRRIVDGVWVGDEPSNVVMSPDGSLAYVALATEAAVVVVDVAAREVVQRFEVNRDPHAMALTSDGATLYVASRRSGETYQGEYAPLLASDQDDIVGVDTSTGAITAEILDLGGFLGGLALSADDATLYVTSSRSDPSAALFDAEDPNWFHEVVALDTSSNTELVRANLTTQPSSGGVAPMLHGLAVHDGSVWVVSEGAEAVLELDPTTLEERMRMDAPGRPRDVLVSGGALYAHGMQGMQVTRYGLDGFARVDGETGPDPRPAHIALGQRIFTGPGQTEYGAVYSCNSCHADGLGDRQIWQVGPFQETEASRAFVWLDATGPVGWGGYLGNVRNSGWAGGTTSGVISDSEGSDALGAYMGSIAAPPPANHLTKRGGALSEAGERGKALYDGAAACAACHPLPLTTHRVTLEEGITPGRSDTPVLAGVYRNLTWLKTGEARTLREGVEAALDFVGNSSLSSTEVDDLTRYVSELTGRDFFVMVTEPEVGTKVSINEPLTLLMSMPVWDDPTNLNRVTLRDASGAEVAATVAAVGQRLIVTPAAVLERDAVYTVAVEASLESFDERAVGEEMGFDFVTPAKPDLFLDGDYQWVVDLATPNFEEQIFDATRSVPRTYRVETTLGPSGAELRIHFRDDLIYDVTAIVEGDQISTPNTPLYIGPNFAGSSGLDATLVDDDGDAVVDWAEGTLLMTGPTFRTPGVTWRLERPPADGACEEGSDGDVEVTFSLDDEDRPVISWPESSGEALGVYVTTPNATLPFGPGIAVAGGEAFWALAPLAFPDGFAGPVTYGITPEGAEDDSELHGADVGGSPLVEGDCYEFSVITNTFAVASYTIRL